MSAIVPNALWAFDFLFDECANGQNLKFFAVEDEFTRASLAIEVDARYRAQHVVATLNRLCGLRGKPAFVRCGNGSKIHHSRHQELVTALWRQNRPYATRQAMAEQGH
jgi:putative transposase